MSQAQAPLPVTGKTRTHRNAHRRRRQALPPELVVSVLECLSNDELWTAARVSREFYLAVWRAGLSIHRQIDWCLDSGTISGVAVFRDLVKHALPKELPIGLTLVCLFKDESEWPNTETFDISIQPQLDEIFGIITAALPLLVHLTIGLPDPFIPGLLNALRDPAPRLRVFEISRPTPTTTCPALPPDLFACSAPQLRVLALRTITLPDERVTAFRSVSSLQLEYAEAFPHIPIAYCFPHLTGLRLKFSDAVSDSPQCFGLSGLTLQWLVIDDVDSTGMADAVHRSIDLSAVPVVHIIGGETINWSEPHCARDNANLSIRFTPCSDGRGDICVAVVPADLRWRRIYRLFICDMDRPFQICDLPNIRIRLTYLRIDAMFLRFFLALEFTLTALRGLLIDMRANGLDRDMISPPGYYAEIRLESFIGAPPAPEGSARLGFSPCPALEEITLFALDAPISGVESRRIAFLARALGQVDRPRSDKAALALVGVALAHPVARTLLSQTVSKISTYAFSGSGSCEGFDNGLWEDGL